MVGRQRVNRILELILIPIARKKKGPSPAGRRPTIRTWRPLSSAMREPRRGQVAWEGEGRDLDDYMLLRRAFGNSYTLVLLGSVWRNAICDGAPIFCDGY